MATTFVEYTGDGNATKQFTFPSYQESDVKVRVDGVLKTTSTHYNITGYTTTGGGNVVFTSGNIPSSPANIRIYRDTNVDTAKATFTAGSSVKAADLNNNTTQLLYRAQEEQIPNLIHSYDIDDGAITSAKFGADSVTSDKIADDSINSEHYVDGSIDTQHIADSQITSAKIADGTIVNADINASAAIDGSKIAASTTSAAGSMSAADKTKLDGIETAATADQTAAEIRTLVESATDSNVFTDADHTKLNGIETGATADQTNAEIRAAVEAATDSNVFTDADHSKLNAIEAGATTDQTASEIKTLLQSDKLTANEIATNAVTTDKIADGELTTLAGMQSTTASNLASSTALTATTAELNQLDGITLETSITTNSDTRIPTSKAVNDLVLSVTNALGGFVAIANETSFPTTNPDPSNNAGTVVSISQLSTGLAVNSSGVATISNGAGTGNTVTITGFPSNLQSQTLPVSSGLQVQTTSTLHTYTFHKQLASAADIQAISATVNSFSNRYRVSASAPTSSLDGGDLWYDTTNSKLMVYSSQNSAWEESSAIGNFFISTISSSSNTGGGSATPNGTAYRFTISDAPVSAQQLLVSVDGVIQKPNSGSSQPSEGFVLVGNDIIFGAAPANGASIFVTVIGSTVGIGTPSDNTVTTAILQNGSVTTAKITDANVTTAKIADDAVTAAKLADTSVTAGSYGSSTSIPSITVDAQGRITAASGNTVNTDLVGDTSPQLGGLLDTNNQNIKWLDSSGGGNNRALFGSGNDLQIYHDSNTSFIDDAGTGPLNIRTNNSNINIKGGGSFAHDLAIFKSTEGVELYYNNSKKFETTSAGATVTGTLTATSFSGDGSNLTGTGVTSDNSNNTIAGTAAGDAFNGASNNSLFGKNAGTELTSGSESVAIGFDALATATTASYNVAIGNSALKLNTTGNSNVAIGYFAADANTTGNALVAVGAGALGGNTTGLENTAVGSVALQSNTTASNNTAVGRQALQLNTTGNSNTAVGKGALTSNTTSSYNSAFGKEALTANTTGGYNTAVGTQALYVNTTGAINTALGYQTLYNNTTGAQNVAVGHQGLYSNTTGNYNVAIGKDALELNTTASNNTAVGYLALRVNTTAASTTAVGAEALKSNTTGGEGAAFGKGALLSNTTGYSNTAMGCDALDANTTGYQHTAVGRSVLGVCTTGIKNSALGWNAGGTTTTGGHNVYIGTQSGWGHTTGSNSIYIGNVSMPGGGSEGQAICIGTSCSSKGNYRITFGTNANGRVYNQYTSNATWTRESDIRLKKEIATNTDCGLDFINDLRTVTYKWKAPSEVPSTFVNYDANQTEAIHKEKLYGFIAQEVKEVLDKHNITDFNGWTQDPDGLQGISYEMFIMPLVKAVQELSAKVSALEAA